MMQEAMGILAWFFTDIEFGMIVCFDRHFGICLVGAIESSRHDIRAHDLLYLPATVARAVQIPAHAIIRRVPTAAPTILRSAMP